MKLSAVALIALAPVILAAPVPVAEPDAPANYGDYDGAGSNLNEYSNYGSYQGGGEYSSYGSYQSGEYSSYEEANGTIGLNIDDDNGWKETFGTVIVRISVSQAVLSFYMLENVGNLWSQYTLVAYEYAEFFPWLALRRQRASSGQEICSGGQRIHNAAELRANMTAVGMSEDGMEDYLTAFDLGAPPHAGAGLGLERIVAWVLELGDVRYASLFHRDPKSLPTKPPGLPHPEADTTKLHQVDDPPLLEKLIANYGDATNTSWLDERFQIWRHETGAAVGWFQQQKFAMITGDPLCDCSLYQEMLVSFEVQKILTSGLRWWSLSCIEEQRLDDERHNSAQVSSLAAKVRRVEREGVKIHEVKLDNDFIARADPAIEEWKAARKGKQVHLTELRPWIDQEHRRCFAAEKDGKVVSLVVLAKIAPCHGWQVKWALDFPGAVNGTIEVLISHALSNVTDQITFGAGVSERLTPGEHVSGLRARFLVATYRSIVDSLGLRHKSTFRSKFGALGEEVYICYLKHGVTLLDLPQIVKFFQD
ncbi:related to aspartate-tRNA ligase [Fusarium oxysporum]|uniref:Related to aspartate-tRNA ligase n=1 Tax=Fusarium oxysporum TaxID=5507 RepID=A0A2H3TIR0_FUSOX|nr:related to aspartate-tRNA ligase [Fusarium oxysporum]